MTKALRSPFIPGGLLRSLQIILFLFLSIAASSQEIRVVDGRKYMVHSVQQGQTLYAISRTYAVDVEDITKANPGAEAGLSIGQELLIPQDAVNKKEARSAPVMAADGELVHTVARKETLFGIARNYNIDVNALLDRNPELNAGLKEGMTVVIPVSNVGGQPPAATRPAVPERILEHIVQPGETLYSLGKLYVVPPEAIEAANDGLPEGLKAGSTVLIPLRIGLEPPPPTRADSLLLRQRYRIGFLLPFSLGRNDSLIAATTDDPKFYEPSRIAAQFYAGARIALDSLEKIGLRADVTVLDQGDEARIWNSVMRKPEIKEMDLFIGPFHRSAIEELVRINPKAHIVCPVPQSNKLLLGNPSVSKVTPTRSDRIRHTARYVAQRYALENILLVRTDSPYDMDAHEQMQSTLQQALNDQPARSRDTVLIVPLERKEMAPIVGALQLEKQNVIVAPSEDLEFVTALVRILKQNAAKYRITIVGLENWLNYETIAASDLDLLGFTFAASSYVDIQDEKVQDFMLKFKDRFNTDADEYAFLGFDVTFYYLKALMTQGTNFYTNFSSVRMEPLHMGFRMSRAGPENGFRNEHSVMLQQKDLQLVKIP